MVGFRYSAVGVETAQLCPAGETELGGFVLTLLIAQVRQTIGDVINMVGSVQDLVQDLSPNCVTLAILELSL